MASNKPIDELLDEKPNPIKKVITGIVILMLLGSNAYLFMQLQQKNAEVDTLNRNVATAKVERDSLNTEVDKLEIELNALREQNTELDSLLSVKDKEIEQKIIQIRKLINSSDPVKLAKAKTEIDALKVEAAGYKYEMEELRKRNQELTQQNSELNTTLGDVKLKNDALSKEKGMLADKVKLGSQMLAANIKMEAVSIKGSKEKVTTKAKSAKKFKICFTVLQNLVVEKGPRDLYVRILGPDKAIMSSNVDNTFIYKDKPTVYSEKKQYQFDNKSIDMCIYWDKTQDQLGKGEYSVELYDNVNMMGKGTLTLK